MDSSINLDSMGQAGWSNSNPLARLGWLHNEVAPPTWEIMHQHDHRGAVGEVPSNVMCPIVHPVRVLSDAKQRIQYTLYISLTIYIGWPNRWVETGDPSRVIKTRIACFRSRVGVGRVTLDIRGDVVPEAFYFHLLYHLDYRLESLVSCCNLSESPNFYWYVILQQ